MIKQIKTSFLAFCVISVSLFSCDNTLNLVEPGKDTPIVYSLLSGSTNEQYVRVERAFIDETRPASEIAQIPDSLYYQNAKVSLVNLTTNRTFELSKVNAGDLGFQRDEGFFPTDPNFIYYYSGEEDDFQGADRVRLELDRGDNFETVSAEIQLLDTILLVTPTGNTPVSFPSVAKYKMQWIANQDNLPSRYKINMYLHYNEADLTDAEPEPVEKVLVWNFAEVIDETVAEAAGSDFYKLFSSNLEADPKYVRTFEFFDIEIIYTGQELERYLEFLNANTGITSSQPIPPYTNLSDGFGLVGEREYKYRRNFFISPTTKDSLSDGQYTSDLGFQ